MENCIKQTSLSLEEIELAIIGMDEFNIRRNVVVPNVSWGFLNHEADILVMSKSGYLTEIEIKRSLSDLRADFKKKHDHSDERIKYFYYCVPLSLLQDAIDLCVEHKRIVSGVITYTEKSKMKIHRIDFGEYGIYRDKFNYPRKLFLEEQFQVARLGSMRVWGMQKKFVERKNIEE